MIVPQKLKIKLPYNSATSFLGIHTKELEAGAVRAMYTAVFMATLFPAAKAQKQPKCPSTDECVSKAWCILLMEYYPALERKKILTQATTEMNPEDIMPSEISYKRTRTIWFHLQEILAGVKFLEAESRRMGTRSWGKGELLCNRYRISVLQKRKMLWRSMVMMAAKALWMYFNILRNG